MKPKRTSPPVKEIQTRVLPWYDHHQRDLPWRDETDPYRIWVSEVMLQQTQVKTVIPYYHRFLEQFPTLETLAEAPLQDVLKAWEGLGYYARARNLHKAAQELIENYQGQLPQDYSALRKLPGFGEYTAGAVASIAFGKTVPAIDGNVRRLLSRLFALQTDVRRGEGAREIKKLARQLVHPQRPGDWTQALIELGAMVCQSRTPDCFVCPLETICQARLQGLEHQLPLKTTTKKRPHYEVTAAVIRHQEKFLIAQRPPEGMLGGLWEFPGGKQETGETLPACLQREIREELGIEISVGSLITTVKHGYTHFKIRLYAFECRLLNDDQQPQALEVADWRWVTLEEMAHYPFPRTDQKIIEAIREMVS